VEALCLNANTKAKVTVGHVSIEVSNITFSRKFYEPVFKHLRFQVIMDQKDVLGLSNGLLSIFLAQPDSRRIERKEPKAEDFAIADHIALLVPDRKTVDEVTLVMKEAGFEPLFAPEEHPEFVPGYYSASFSDPDNNVIEFYVVQKS
jgi:predicted lactoylglutathione lyase